MNSPTSFLAAQMEWLVKKFDSENILDANAKFGAAEGWDFVTRVLIVYVVGVVMMGRWMAERRPLEVQKLRTVWNIILSVCSAIGILAVLPETFQILRRESGLHGCICDLEQLKAEDFQGWIKYFGYLKLVELGDSILAVMEKKPLTYLHIYHHITMLWVARAAVFHFPVVRLIVASNLVVNFLMYACLALEDTGLISKAISSITTRQQALPRAIMLASGCYAVIMKYTGQACDVSLFGLICVFIVVVSYFVAFLTCSSMNHAEARRSGKQE